MVSVSLAAVAIQYNNNLLILKKAVQSLKNLNNGLHWMLLHWKPFHTVLGDNLQVIFYRALPAHAGLSDLDEMLTYIKHRYYCKGFVSGQDARHLFYLRPSLYLC